MDDHKHGLRWCSRQTLLSQKWKVCDKSCHTKLLIILRISTNKISFEIFENGTKQLGIQKRMFQYLTLSFVILICISFTRPGPVCPGTGVFLSIVLH